MVFRLRATHPHPKVFADRYRSILVEADAHLLELIRYVHLNPVRAGVVAEPSENAWSSHRIYAGLDPAPAWFDTSFILSQFGPEARAARKAYRSFIEDGVGGERRPEFSGDALGDLTHWSNPTRFA